MLRLESLHVAYGAIPAVSGVDLELRAGEVVALVGANGAGKSTILKAILGLVRARGVVRLDGADISAVPAHGRVARGIALSPEGRHVFPRMTVLENLELGTVPRTVPETAQLVQEMLEVFPKLRERLRQAAGSMSGGEQQMLAIARALMSKPKVLMLDEPTLGLAPIIVDQIGDLVLSLKARGLAILLSEQNAEMALGAADRAYVLETGRIVKSGASETIRRDASVRNAYLGLEEDT